MWIKMLIWFFFLTSHSKHPIFSATGFWIWLP
jgi:hypothetical protein